MPEARYIWEAGKRPAPGGPEWRRWRVFENVTILGTYKDVQISTDIPYHTISIQTLDTIGKVHIICITFSTQEGLPSLS